MELVQHQEEKREAKVYRVASELYRQDPDWVTFFREVLGVEGIVRRVFADAADLRGSSRRRSTWTSSRWWPSCVSGPTIRVMDGSRRV